MRSTKLELQKRIDALEVKKHDLLVGAEDRALDEALGRLTVEEMRRLLDLVHEYRDPVNGKPRYDRMTGPDLLELSQIAAIMKDASAPTGKEREERERLNSWLDDFERDGLNDPVLAKWLPMVRSMCERWLKNHLESAAPENQNLSARCSTFLVRSEKV